MTSISFQKGNKVWQRTVPTGWDDMTKAQLLRFCKLLVNQGELNDEHRKISLIHGFLGLPNGLFFNLTLGQADDIFDQFAFLFQECKLTKMLVGNFTHSGVWYYGPQDAFANVRVEEYGWWDKFLVDYCKTQDPKALDMAIACVFRPISLKKAFMPWKWKEDPRVPFNMYTVEKRADELLTLPSHIKHALFLQFIGIRNLKIASNPRVFKKVESYSGPDFGWLGVMIDLAGLQFGTIEQVKTSNTDIVLTFLEKSEIERERSSYTPK